MADCERLVEGFLKQPVNAVSSLAFVLVGVLVPLVVRHRGGRHPMPGDLYGLVLVLVGAGSVAFHGPGGVIADWLHDASITALLLLILAFELGHRAGWSTRQIAAAWAVVAGGLMLVEWVWPRAGDSLNSPLAFFAVSSAVWPQLRPGRRPTGLPKEGVHRARVLGAAIVALGALVMLLSRTGGPLCDPATVVQGHSIWHVLAAVGIGLYAVSVTEIDRPVKVSL